MRWSECWGGLGAAAWLQPPVLRLQSHRVSCCDARGDLLLLLLTCGLQAKVGGSSVGAVWRRQVLGALALVLAGSSPRPGCSSLPGPEAKRRGRKYSRNQLRASLPPGDAAASAGRGKPAPSSCWEVAAGKGSGAGLFQHPLQPEVGTLRLGCAGLMPVTSGLLLPQGIASSAGGVSRGHICAAACAVPALGSLCWWCPTQQPWASRAGRSPGKQCRHT